MSKAYCFNELCVAPFQASESYEPLSAFCPKCRAIIQERSKPMDGYIVAGADMRSAEDKEQERKDDEAKEAHLNWVCDDFCIYCQLQREEGEQSLGG